MLGFKGEKDIYRRMQNHLFELIPESWKTILLHTSIIDVPNQRAKGELYIYYIPKGFVKRKPVNCFEIPTLFDIDEEGYSRLITSLYNLIKDYRDSIKEAKRISWSTIDIKCTHKEFEIKLGFEDLNNSEYTPEEHHIIWRYENLDIDIDSLDKKSRKLLEVYIQEKRVSFPPKQVVIKTEVFERPKQATVDYERTLTLDEVIARDKERARLEEKRQRKIMKKKRKKQLDILEADDTEAVISNEILKGKYD